MAETNIAGRGPNESVDILGGNMNTDPEALLRDQEEVAPVSDPETEVRTDSDEPSAEEIERQQAEETSAREAGWVPEDEWNGDPKRWRSAADYLAVHERVMPIVQRELKATRAELAALKAERQADLQAREQRTREIERETLRMELKEAQTDGNWDRVNEIMEKMLDLRQAPAQTTKIPQRPPPEMQEAFDGIARQNPWLSGPKADKGMAREWARELKNIYESPGTFDGHEDAMLQAVNKIRRTYPEKFRTRPGSFGDAGGEHGRGTQLGRTWNDLKPEFRRAMDEMIERSVGSDGKPMMTREGVLKQCGPEEFQRR